MNFLTRPETNPSSAAILKRMIMEPNREESVRASDLQILHPMLERLIKSPLSINFHNKSPGSAVLRIRIRDPVSFWPPDLGSGMDKKSRSGSAMNIPDHIYKSLETIFGLKYLNSLMRMRIRIRESFWPGIRDGKNSDPGWISRIRNTADEEYFFSLIQHSNRTNATQVIKDAFAPPVTIRPKLLKPHFLRSKTW